MASSAPCTAIQKSAYDPVRTLRTLLSTQQDELGDGSCHTCRQRAVECDRRIPVCRACGDSGRKCDGYGIRVKWPAVLATTKDRRKSRPLATSSQLVPTFPSKFSSFGLPQAENFLLQHYFKNLARISIAIDYYENGYRVLMQAGINDPTLVNSMLAVAASHHSKWQKITDKESRLYLRKAIASLRDRLKDPSLIYSESTIVAMLTLASYEIFNGSKGWVSHFRGITGWLATRGDCSDLDPFIKTWIAMIDTQKAMLFGDSITPEVQRWIESGNSWTVSSAAVDPFFGCSVRLPRLMAAASRLFTLSRTPADIRTDSDEEIRQQAESLQVQIYDTKMDFSSGPALAVSCHHECLSLVQIEDLNEDEYHQRIIAAAEIFRHAAHIYVYRIVHEPSVPPSPGIEHSIDQIFQLLSKVPDALGPGSNLGWCLTVVGAEVDSPDQREYIRGRLRGISSLGMYNTDSGLKTLEKVWLRRDLHHEGYCGLQRWQDIMKDEGDVQILV